MKIGMREGAVLTLDKKNYNIEYGINNIFMNIVNKKTKKIDYKLSIHNLIVIDYTV